MAPTPAAPPKCATCHKQVPLATECNRCGEEVYCSKPCRDSDATTHKQGYGKQCMPLFREDWYETGKAPGVGRLLWVSEKFKIYGDKKLGCSIWGGMKNSKMAFLVQTLVAPRDDTDTADEDRIVQTGCCWYTEKGFRGLYEAIVRVDHSKLSAAEAAKHWKLIAKAPGVEREFDPRLLSVVCSELW